MPNQPTGKIRCGVIGAGWWATYAHIPALVHHPNAELVAIQKRDMDEARRVAADFGVPQVFSSAEELLAATHLDAVVVASSPNMHYEHARAAFRRGLHVLVEKPMTITVAQAAELVSMAEQTRKELIISCPWHYTRHGREARQMISSGRLGKIRMVSVLMTNPVDHLIRGDSANPTHGEPYMKPRLGTYSDPAIAGGGQIYTQGSHVAAYLAFLTGAKPAQVFARFHRDGASMDIYDALNIEMENGSLVSMASTGATALDRRDFEVRVYGTRAILFLELWRGAMQLVEMDQSRETEFAPLSPQEVYPERAPANNLVDCAAGTGANLSPGTLGLAAMEVIEAACASARTAANVVIRPALPGSA